MAEWQKVTSEDIPMWNYKGEFAKTNKPVELMGVYTGAKHNVGANKSSIYTVEDPKGKKTEFWGNTLLDSRFGGIAVGEEVKIVYLGMATNDKTKRTYHNFEIYHKPVEGMNEDVKPEEVLGDDAETAF